MGKIEGCRMSDDVVIIIHDEADELLARDVVRELSQFAAFPVRLCEARPARVGAGAIGVVVWTSVFERLFSARMEEFARDAVILRVSGAPPRSTGHLVEASAKGGHWEALRAAVTEMQAARAQARQRAGRAGATDLAPATVTYSARVGGSRLAVQSASGLAAALAVVGVVTPLIGGGPGAKDNDAAGVGLSLVSDAQAAAVATPAALLRAAVLDRVPEDEPAINGLALSEEDSPHLALLDRRASNPPPRILGDGSPHVEILPNGEVVSGLDSDPIEIVAAGEWGVTATQAVAIESVTGGGLELFVAEDQDFNSFHRLMGPRD